MEMKCSCGKCAGIIREELEALNVEIGDARTLLDRLSEELLPIMKKEPENVCVPGIQGGESGVSNMVCGLRSRVSSLKTKIEMMLENIEL